jgi:hypothetical protein
MRFAPPMDACMAAPVAPCDAMIEFPNHLVDVNMYFQFIILAGHQRQADSAGVHAKGSGVV